jgi:hypothetical protein
MSENTNEQTPQEKLDTLMRKYRIYSEVFQQKVLEDTQKQMKQKEKKH